MRVAAILLAAGASTRFGGEKLLAPWRGRPLYRHALEALAGSPAVASVAVVIRPGFPTSPAPPRCRWVVNPDHAEGMSTSLRAGILAAPADADAYLIALADMPAVTPTLIESLVAFHRAAGSSITAPVCRGRRGHPVLIAAAWREALLGITGDVGARELLRAHPEAVAEFATDDAGVLFDVDEPKDFEAGGEEGAS